ncbi:MAG: hypothetical protein KDE27_02325 [Planctomycetes bacterium]|nr:hypothetical protein [Planctomycetota bacterium]
MKPYCLAVCLLALPALAQEDRIFTVDGKEIDKVRVASWDIRELKYKEGNSEKSLSTDQVVRVELEQFNDVFRLGLRDADLMLTKAREQVAENQPLLAQLGFVRASAMFFDSGRVQEAAAALDEFEKALPRAGALPEIYRQKFEYYIGQGDKQAKSAATVAGKYLSEAQGNAWPAGLALEAEFFKAIADRAAGGTPAEYQSRLESIIQRAGQNVMVGNRANIQLANSYLDAKENDKARRLYEAVAGKAGVDENSRAGAYLGLGLLTMADAGNDAEANKRALLWFLRVYLETRSAWPSLQAEALYNAVQAAGKWRGPESQFIQARCRGALKNEFPDSDWTERALAGR